MNIAFEKIAPRLGTWAELFKPFWEEGGFDEIFSKLKEEGKTYKVLPESKDLFKAFEKCPLDKFCAGIVGQDPYPSIKWGTIVADGLAYSCSYTKEEQPSLKLMWDALEDDIYDGLNLQHIRLTDLSPWAEQGILLLNSSLTTREGDPGKHIEIWKPFMTYFLGLEQIQSKPFVFMGKQAAEYAYLVENELITEHPAYAARQNRPLIHKNLFSWIDGFLEKDGRDTFNFYNVPF